MTTNASQPRWFYKTGDAKSGPVNEDILRDLFASHGLSPDTRVWRHGMETWLPARDVEELFPHGVLQAAPIPAGATGSPWLNERPTVPIAVAILAMCCVGQVVWWWVSSGGDVDNSRRAVSGVVMLDGAPLHGGLITFRPISKEPFGARVPIDSGSFTIPRHKGLSAGRYRVRINKEIPADPPEKGGERHRKPGVEVIPPRYNESTELTAEIAETGRNELRFDLRAK